MMDIVGWLHLELTKPQITGHYSARFKKKIKSFEVGRPNSKLHLWAGKISLSLELLRWEIPPLIWATPSTGNLY